MANRWSLSDWAFLVYCGIVCVLCVLRREALPQAWGYVLGHGVIAGSVLLLVRFDRPGLLGALRAWAALLFVPALFIMAMQIVHRVHPVDYDDWLIRVDRAIGGDTLLRAMVAIERPWLTDLLKLSWMSYYVFPLLAAVPIYRMGRAAFTPFKDALVLAWLSTYLCYFALPARGPGWLPDEVGVPQPKWEDTAVSLHAKRVIEFIDAPEPRHTFPSGHVMIALLVAGYLLRYRRWGYAVVAVPIAAAIMFATVYLRYHYVVDVGVGVLFAAVCAWGAQRLHRLGIAPRILPENDEARGSKLKSSVEDAEEINT